VLSGNEDSGGWIVTWSSYNQDADNYGIFQQQFDNNGIKVGAETLVNNAESLESSYSSGLIFSDDGLLGAIDEYVQMVPGGWTTVIVLSVILIVVAGSNSTTFDIVTLDDIWAEGIESYNITVTNITGGGFSSAAVVGAGITTGISKSITITQYITTKRQ